MWIGAPEVAVRLSATFNQLLAGTPVIAGRPSHVDLQCA
jgi:hypothetical protein